MSPTRRVRIAAKTVEAPGICSFDLVDVEAGRLPAYTAGSHIDVHLPGGLIRQYSLCNDPRELHRYQIAVLRERLRAAARRPCMRSSPGRNCRSASRGTTSHWRTKSNTTFC